MGFDSEGNLYVTTGDSNSSQSTNGYSGNYQPARCPTGARPWPPTTTAATTTSRTTMRAGPQAAPTTTTARCCASTRSTRSPDGAQPTIGVSTTYSCRPRPRRTAPNLFSGTEGNGNQAKPEIYAMGLRNPSRLFDRPRDRHPVLGVGRPRRRLAVARPKARRRTRTPRSSPRPATTAGPTAWATSRPTATASPTARCAPTNAAGYVNGGPAGARRRAGTTARTSSTTRRTTPASPCSPTRPGPGRTRARRGRPTSGTAAATRAAPTAARRSPRPLGPDDAPDYGATPTQLCPYLTASGATVFNGPVYRYDDDAEDNSARWPEYWDGRWFLQDFGNNSAKHGLLLDPATDQDGGKPVYADSLRGVLNWNNNYMDSKFGPDGALYVQVYDGLLHDRSGAGLYRFAYTGGPDTPNPDPQWATTATPTADPVLARQLRRRLLRVGLRRRQRDRPRSRARRTRTPRPARTTPS